MVSLTELLLFFFYFPQKILLQNATESSVPLPEHPNHRMFLTCFPLMSYMLSFYFTMLQIQAKRMELPPFSLLPADYITAMETEEI